MSQLYFRVCLLFTAIFLVSCATQKTPPKTIQEIYPISERQQHIAALSYWKASGKIAFITPKEKQSASINWLHQTTNQQEINLTSYLGINVFKLSSDSGSHTIEVDGETYRSNNLDQLIYQLTGLTFPSDALAYWLKGIPYTQKDTVTYDINGLPKKIISTYQERTWQINYGKYQQIHNHMLPAAMTVVRGNLKIKLQLKQWNLS